MLRMQGGTPKKLMTYANEIINAVQHSENLPLDKRLHTLEQIKLGLLDVARRKDLESETAHAASWEDALKATTPLHQAEKTFFGQVETLQSDVSDASQKSIVEAIKAKPESERTTPENQTIKDYDQKKQFVENTIKDYLTSYYGWDGRSRAMFEMTTAKEDGPIIQTAVNNAITRLLNDGRVDPAVQSILKAKGLPPTALDDWIGLPMKAKSAADHVGADYLLVNKTTGKMHLIDVTSSVSNLRPDQAVDSFALNPDMGLSGTKQVPLERQRFVIGADVRQLKPRNTTPNISDAFEKSTTISPAKLQSQVAEILADMISKDSGLDIFTTPLPSGAIKRPPMRQVFEINRFREALIQNRLTDWADSLKASMKHVFNKGNDD